MITMSPDYSIVNAFTTSAGPQSGNQAAVVMLPAPSASSPSDEWRALIARDFGFSETAYVEPLSPGRWLLRWFTPEVEVELCGHATLAASAVLFEREPTLTLLTFETRFAGELHARKVDFGIEISLPTLKQEYLDTMGEGDKPAIQAATGLRADQIERVFKWPWGGGDSCIIQISRDVPLRDLQVDPKQMVRLKRSR
jgi:PhzF family phenazine biosynthesis protein